MTPRLPVDIGPISDELGQSMDVSLSVEADEFVLGGESFPVTERMDVEASIMETGDCLVLTGSVSTTLTLSCSRCLEDFDHVVESKMEKCYSSEAGIDPEGDPDMEPIAESTIDLWPAISASVAESIPFAPLCDPGCAGICAACGATLSEGDCGCRPDAPDSPFSVLKDLLDQDEADGTG